MKSNILQLKNNNLSKAYSDRSVYLFFVRHGFIVKWRPYAYSNLLLCINKNIDNDLYLF